MTVICSKTLISLLFLSILYFNLASAQLLCWQCDPCPDPFDNSSSLVSLATCTSSQTICVKNTISTPSSARVAKGCVSSCTPSSPNSFGSGASVACCNTNYCNLSTKKELSLTICILFMPLYWLISYLRQYT
ncbi:unnamed protein product [Rotaria magnacalcarata]|uniref:Snake toxin/toxin-like domain-containing protein n=1 Tax=Rotaria magnacalcarata TaxID=392030 RepID=A0A816LUQ1_9BILA|nr:unnamed protein product [Rotaria magnacalcarata]CAF1991974.1 unnamed protein product [Rotaria magnacalcarata]CAF2041089.1 unnamed protein product [Rotaria magnacalcarata]CAF3812821.1 unnamed protein product [Rotaria magnacalcarata]CAF3881437.1 unnamed protein product [Rotaria magnacalcarata]